MMIFMSLMTHDEIYFWSNSSKPTSLKAFCSDMNFLKCSLISTGANFVVISFGNYGVGV